MAPTTEEKAQSQGGAVCVMTDLSCPSQWALHRWAKETATCHLVSHAWEDNQGGSCGFGHLDFTEPQKTSGAHGILTSSSAKERGLSAAICELLHFTEEKIA